MPARVVTLGKKFVGFQSLAFSSRFTRNTISVPIAGVVPATRYVICWCRHIKYSSLIRSAATEKSVVKQTVCVCKC